MEQQTLPVEMRENVGKGASRKTRRTGKVPGILYGLGHHTSLTLDPIIIKKYLLQEGGRNIIFNLGGSGLEGRHAMIKDYQVDPVTRNLLHVDLLEIDPNKKVLVTVKLNYVGKAAGVTDGGVLQVIERDIKLRCLPTGIPKHIDVDVSALKIGDSIHLDQISVPEGIEKVTLRNATLVTVVPPAKEEELKAELTPAAEPEVITEKKEAKAEEGAAVAPEEKVKEKKEKEEKKK